MRKIHLELVDKSEWSSLHTLMFFSLAVGFFMWGVVSSIAPLIYSSIKNIYFLMTPVYGLIAGDLALPFLSDKELGRKTSFFMTMGLYSFGTILIIATDLLANLNGSSLASMPYILLLGIGVFIGFFGVEGEVPIMLSYMAEMMPLKYREQILILAPNFNNIGMMISALVGYLTSHSPTYELLSIGLVAVLGIATAVVIRLSLPESVRWLVVKGKTHEAEIEAKRLVRRVSEIKEGKVEKRVSLGFSFLFLILIGISQFLTTALMSYLIADLYFSGKTLAFIIFIANLSSSIAGFIATLIINKVKTKRFTLFSYLGGTLSMIPIILLTKDINLGMFYVLLSINMFFSEFAWSVRAIYEAVLMPSISRAFMIGLVRLAPAISSISLLAVLEYLSRNLFLYLVYALVLWAIGGGASIMWYFKGIDVNFVRLEEIYEEKIQGL